MTVTTDGERDQGTLARGPITGDKSGRARQAAQETTRHTA